MIVEDESVRKSYLLTVADALANNEIIKGKNKADVETKLKVYKDKINKGEQVEIKF